MSKAKLVLAAFVAVLAMGAVMSASASAAPAGWMVNRTILTTTKALATTAQVEATEKAELAGAGFKIKCNGKTLNGEGPMISAASMGLAKSLEFTECVGEGECELVGTTIKTVPILAEATLEGTSAVKVGFTPQTKKIFTEITLAGGLCSLAGINPVTGKATVSAPTGQTESTLQLIKSITTVASNELKVGSTAASLVGAALLRLASGESWSYL